MKLVKISKNGVEIGRSQMLEPNEWIEQCSSLGVWGKPKHWIRASESHDLADVIERESRELSPEMAAVIDEDGKEVSPAVPAVTEEWVRLRAEYTVEIEDISAQHALAEVIAKRKAEYPSPEDLMDAFFDGGDEALEALRQRRLAIKAKYPKE